MLVTFFLAGLILSFLKPSLTFFEVMEKNIGFFLPIFGNNSVTIASLGLPG